MHYYHSLRDTISISQDICDGVPCVKDTRIPVDIIRDCITAKLSDDEIIDHYPSLNKQVLSRLRLLFETVEYLQKTIRKVIASIDKEVFRVKNGSDPMNLSKVSMWSERLRRCNDTAPVA